MNERKLQRASIVVVLGASVALAFLEAACRTSTSFPDSSGGKANQDLGGSVR